MPMPLQTGVAGQQLKEPQNAFGLFLADKNEDLATELGKDMADPEVEQLAADRWKALSPAERGPWQKKAAALHFQYQAQKSKAAAADGGTPTKKLIKAKASPKKTAPKKTAPIASNASMAPLVEAAKKAKRPSSAYWLYVQASRPKIAAALGGSPSVTDIAKKGAEMWKAASDEEKAPFEEQAKAAKEAFDKFKESDEGKEALKIKQRLMKEKRAAKEAMKARRTKRATISSNVGARKEPLKVKNMLPKRRQPKKKSRW